MSEQGGMTTLIGREETHGRRFPTMMERLVFLISIVGAVFLGQWMWVEADWANTVLWPATICGLPLATLLVAEMLSRIIQRIHMNGE